jgi:hypothetical protein
VRRRALILCLTLAAVALYAAEFVLQDKVQRHEPFPESRLQLNPPTFRWPAASGTSSYRVELARTRSFESPQSTVVSESFHRPLQPLETGTWFWRYRLEHPVAGAWSKPESFAITNHLARWPVPDWKQLAARIPAGHPRLYLRAEERTRIKANARTLGAEWEQWKNHTRHSVEQPYALDTYKQRVPAASNPRAKKELVWAAKAAGVDVAHPIGDLAWIWIATGDRWFLNAAKQRAMLAASLDPHGFVSEKNSDFGNSAIVNGLALAYDLLYDELSESERSVIRRSITARCRPIFETLAGASQNLMRAHNWQHVFLDGLMGAIAIHGEEPAAHAWVDLGLRSFVALYPWFGGNDGGSHEGARYYHATEMIPSLNVRDLFHNVFGLRLEDGNPWFRANPYYLLYAFPPGSVKARLGDSTIGTSGEDDEDDAPYPGGRARLAALRMATLYGNGHAASYAASIAAASSTLKHPIAETLRWGLSTTVKPEPLANLPAARLFRDIGAVFTHSDYTHPDRNVRLVFHSSPYGALGHAHADQNSFHLIAANEDLLIDSGYYTPAGDPHRQQWSLQTKAHNTILVNGKGQSYGDTRGHGKVSHFAQNDDWVYMVGSAESAYPNTPLQRFDRHIVWLKGQTVQTFVVVDEIAAGTQGAPPRFDWLLHAADRMQVNDAARQITVRSKKSEAVVTFTSPDQLRFEQTDQFDVPAVFWRKGKNFPLPNQWHLKATPATAAARQTFATVIQVSARGAAKPKIQQLTDGGIATAGFRVQHDAGSHLLRIERTPTAP